MSRVLGLGFGHVDLLECACSSLGMQQAGRLMHGI